MQNTCVILTDIFECIQTAPQKARRVVHADHTWFEDVAIEMKGDELERLTEELHTLAGLLLLDKHVDQRPVRVDHPVILPVPSQHMCSNRNQHPLAVVELVLAVNVEHVSGRGAPELPNPTDLRIGHVSDMYQTCVGHVTGMYRACIRT